MANEEKIDLPDENIFGGPLSKLSLPPNRLKNRRIIRSADLPEIQKIMTIGGDCKDSNDPGPSIILERDGDRITRIIVKCCCGRHAELECEEEAENNDNEE
ncbi:MAG: hypothetical protein NE327_16930 [Lentisphaeraceae bacterium]|nr:hypothetical protein [Lentisphaeraceae bacterium]